MDIEACLGESGCWWGCFIQGVVSVAALELVSLDASSGAGSEAAAAAAAAAHGRQQRSAAPRECQRRGGVELMGRRGISIRRRHRRQHIMHDGFDEIIHVCPAPS